MERRSLARRLIEMDRALLVIADAAAKIADPRYETHLRNRRRRGAPSRLYQPGV